MSPCVATTRLSLTATMTPQPVPQKRQGALAQSSRASSPGMMPFAAWAAGIPATLAAMAAAFALIIWRRVSSSMGSLLGIFVDLVIDQRCGDGARHVVDGGDAGHRLGFGSGLQDDDELAL